MLRNMKNGVKERDVAPMWIDNFLPETCHNIDFPSTSAITLETKQYALKFIHSHHTHVPFQDNHIIITLNPKVADYYHFQSSVCVKHLVQQFRFLINIVHFRRSLQKQISQILCSTVTYFIEELEQKSHRAKHVPCALPLCQPTAEETLI